MFKNLYNFFLFFMGILAIGLGVYGFRHCNIDPCVANSSWLATIFNTLNLVRGNGRFIPDKHPLTLVIAQFALPLVALLTTARLFIDGLRRDLRVVMARGKRKHTIVCGIGEIGMQIIQNLRSDHHGIVAIDLDVDSSNAVSCERSGIPVLKGDAKIPNVLRAAGITRARRVVLCTGVDAENVDIALRIQELIAGRRQKLTVLAELRSEWLYSKLINHDKQALGSSDLDLILFNTYSSAARMLVRALRVPPRPEVEADTFVIVGFGDMGREAALHLVRAVLVPLGRTLKIVIIDSNATELGKSFSASFSAACEVADFHFIDADLQSGATEARAKVEEVLRIHSLFGLAMCLDNDERNLNIGLEIRALFDQIGQLRVPVFIRLQRYKDLGAFASSTEKMARFADRLCVFGTLDELHDPESLSGAKLDALAKLLHESYRNRPKDELNPRADVQWHDLPEFMKMSNRWRADHAPIMLALAGLRMKEDAQSPVTLELTSAEIEMIAQLEHRRYVIERRLLRWQYSETRHQGRKQAPHLAEWVRLSDGQRDWNRKEVAKLPEILAELGIQLQRECKIRAYGPELNAAVAQIEAALATPTTMHYLAIADIDTPEGRRAAMRATYLPSISLWLTSDEEPEELFHPPPKGTADDFSAVIECAEGWMRRESAASVTNY
jgi:hypothetical protein